MSMHSMNIDINHFHAARKPQAKQIPPLLWSLFIILLYYFNQNRRIQRLWTLAKIVVHFFKICIIYTVIGNDIVKSVRNGCGTKMTSLKTMLSEILLSELDGVIGLKRN